MLKLVTVNILYDDVKNAHLSKTLQKNLDNFYDMFDVINIQLQEEEFFECLIKNLKERKKGG